jgi:hypothetical protein
MIELKYNKLHFSFPDLHPDAKCGISFGRFIERFLRTFPTVLNAMSVRPNRVKFRAKSPLETLTLTAAEIRLFWVATGPRS